MVNYHQYSQQIIETRTNRGECPVKEKKNKLIVQIGTYDTAEYKKNKKTIIVYNMTNYMDLIITNEDR